MNSLETYRITFHPYIYVSNDCLFQLFSNSELLKYTDVPIITKESELLQVHAFISQPHRSTWFLYSKQQNMFIGIISAVTNTKHCTTNITFILLPAFQKQGFMHEALESIHRYLFETCLIYRIEAQVYVKNKPSINLLEACGYEKEGLLRKNFMIEGKLEDSFIYALLKK